MATILGGLAFAVFLIAQIAAVMAVNRVNNTRRPDAFDAIRRDRGARVIWDSAN
ncbi:MAG TPA: hypothetical protein VF991_01175 [Reyranella sp.]|jgi:hypothetical protein